MLLHVLRHVDAHHGLIVVEQEAGQRTRQLGLADARGPRNMNEPMGRFGSCRPARARRTAVDTARDRLGLADDALAELVLHPEQLVLLAFEHLLDRNAGPARDDARDVIRRHGLLHHAAARIGGVFHGLQPFFEIGYDAIGQLARPREIAFALNLLKLDARSVQLLLNFVGGGELFLLFFPAPRQRARLVFEIGDFLLQPASRSLDA